MATTTTTNKKKSDKMEMSDSDEDIDLISSNNNKNNKQNPANNNNNSVTNKNQNQTKNKNKKYLTTYSSSNKMWVEKYRPSSLNDIVSHKSIISTISQLVSLRKLPHLLFYGPPGTGKTTTILATAKSLNGVSWKSMTLELNASDDRGIDVIRDQIKTFASTQQIFHNGFKLIILDEADAMTSSAQFALRRIMEKYTKNTRFCLICNYINKIIPALQSRCTKFRFAPLNNNDIKIKLLNVVTSENININDAGVNAILNLSNGDMRRCLNILQSAYTSYKQSGNQINDDNIYEVTGKPKPNDIQTILNYLLNQDFNESYTNIQKLQQLNGLALVDIIQGIYKLVIRMKLDSIILCQVLSQLSDLEHRLTVATNEKVQLASLVAIFQVVRHEAFKLQRQKKQ